MPSTPFARWARRRTVLPMHTTPTSRFINTLEAIAASETRTAAVLVTQLLTLTRHYEVLGGAVQVTPAQMTISALAFNQNATIERTVLLSATASVLLGGHTGDAADLLRLPVTNRGALIGAMRDDLASVELPPTDLEDLPLIACHALLHEAQDKTARHAVLTYAGLPAQTARAAKERAALRSESLAGVAALIDTFASRAGLEAQTPHQVTQA